MTLPTTGNALTAARGLARRFHALGIVAADHQGKHDIAIADDDLETRIRR